MVVGVWEMLYGWIALKESGKGGIYFGAASRYCRDISKCNLQYDLVDSVSPDHC